MSKIKRESLREILRRASSPILTYQLLYVPKAGKVIAVDGMKLTVTELKTQEVEMTYVTCPSCGGLARESDKCINNFRYVVCTECGIELYSMETISQMDSRGGNDSAPPSGLSFFLPHTIRIF